MVIYVKLRSSALPAAYEYKETVLKLKRSDVVVVESKHGTTYGKVSSMVCEDESVKNRSQLNRILRKATSSDLTKIKSAHLLEDDAMEFCKQQIQENRLKMKVVNIESTISGKKLTFYFTAEQRIDFREMVKNLAARFKARIEMVQIGVRDQARRINGIGTCGTQLCCNSFISNFEPVTIKMAKNQSLSLNPAKISGICGRLMCCLAFEYDPSVKPAKRVRRKPRAASGCQCKCSGNCSCKDGNAEKVALKQGSKAVEAVQTNKSSQAVEQKGVRTRNQARRSRRKPATHGGSRQADGNISKQNTQQSHTHQLNPHQSQQVRQDGSKRPDHRKTASGRGSDADNVRDKRKRDEQGDRPAEGRRPEIVKVDAAGVQPEKRPARTPRRNRSRRRVRPERSNVAGDGNNKVDSGGDKKEK